MCVGLYVLFILWLPFGEINDNNNYWRKTSVKLENNGWGAG